MEMTIDLTQIILAIITLIGAIVVRYLVPLLKEKLGNEKYSFLTRLIDVGVYAAEQTMKSEDGEAKKLFVQNLLKKNGYDVDMAEVDAAIEAAVRNMKVAMGK